MLANTKDNKSEMMAKLKSNLFNTALIKELQKQYATEVFVKGL